MNVLDAIIVVLALLAAVGGFRLGFVARVLSWAGLAAGVLLAVVFLPDVTASLTRTEARTRLIVAFVFVVGIAMIGQAIGLACGGVVRKRVQLPPAGVRLDRIAGAVLGAFGVLVIVWLAIPALANAPGWPARAARDSSIVRELERVAPDPPPALEALARQVGQTGPEVLGRLVDPPVTGTPPTSGLPAGADALGRASTVKVEGTACEVIQDGSGFVVADDVVVTNAHVVAGERRTAVITPGGDTLGARVVGFDPGRDLAVLSVPGLELDPLTIGARDVGAIGAVYGHPGGGPLVTSPARIEDRITAVGRDIYGDRRTERDVFVLAADIRPGDSGGALVDELGQVVGVAFAIDPGRPGTAYALADTELRAALDERGSRTSAVSTGPCLVG
ncbi:MAG: MarP family serine protease [Acidimicrobiia bacterium]